jgi:predicted transposase YbfD/YdcC
LAGDSRFPGIKAIAMVENTFEHNGKTSCERRYYISSAVLLAMIFANAVRCHWHIENRLHWRLDVIFHPKSGSWPRVRPPILLAYNPRLDLKLG